jgi:hypothetical protein
MSSENIYINFQSCKALFETPCMLSVLLCECSNCTLLSFDNIMVYREDMKISNELYTDFD